MLRRRIRRGVPGLNTTSTADISFMLLIFFLVTTSIDTDKGLMRQLPPPPPADKLEELSVKQRNVLNVSLDEADRLTCDGRTVTLEQLQKEVESFVENAADDPSKPEKTACNIPLLGACRITAKHIVSVQADRRTSYKAYFAMQNAIVAAYNSLRDRLARNRFGRPYKACRPAEREAVGKYYPQRISEAEPSDGKGGRQ